MGSAGTDSKPAPVASDPDRHVRRCASPAGCCASTAAIWRFDLLPLFDLVGTMFINLLKMIIVPLILASVITGVAALGSGPDLGRLGSKTLALLRADHADRRADRAVPREPRRAGRERRPARGRQARAHRRRGAGDRRRQGARRHQRARHHQGHRAAQHRRSRRQHQVAGDRVLLGGVRLLPRAHRAASPGHGDELLAGHLPDHDAHDRLGDDARAHRRVRAHRQGGRCLGIRRRGAAAAVRRLRGRSALRCTGSLRCRYCWPSRRA